jgi:hypothetical protein
MSTPTYTETQLQALRDALAKGEKRVTFGDKTVEGLAQGRPAGIERLGQRNLVEPFAGAEAEIDGHVLEPRIKRFNPPLAHPRSRASLSGKH